MKFWWNVFKSALTDFMEDKALRLAAALAYYSIFSLAPLLIIMIAIAGFAFHNEAAAKQQVQRQLTELVGEKSAQTIESMTAARNIGSTPLAMTLGILALLFGAGGVFGQLQDALNTIWEVKAKSGGGVLRLLRDRFLSLTMVLGLGFLLLISMAITTGVQALTEGVGQLFPIPDGVTVVISLVASFFVVALLFALIFKVLPDVKVPWKTAFIGGVGTAVLFTIGKWALGLYLGRESTASAYGAAGSLVIVLLWIYYSSVILFFGAEFTQAYATKKGIKLRLSGYAVPVTPEARAQEGLSPGGDIHPMPAPAPALAQTLSPRQGTINGPLAVLQRDHSTHPWRSVFLAWGFGILTGWICRRKTFSHVKNL
jgi:membrane protein